MLNDVSLDQSTEAMRMLERTQMLQNLGKLTAGVAHEINMPIQFIGDNLQFLSDGFDDLLSLLEFSYCNGFLLAALWYVTGNLTVLAF